MNSKKSLKMLRRHCRFGAKATYGNIFRNIDTLEDVIKVKESQFEIMPTIDNKAELHKEEDKLRR